MRRTPPLVLLGLSSLFAGACAPAIMYPPEQGVLASSVTANEPVPTLMAKAIGYANAEWGDEGDLIVNLPPARRHWKNMQPFLFLRPDGRYEICNRAKHPETIG